MKRSIIFFWAESGPFGNLSVSGCLSSSKATVPTVLLLPKDRRIDVLRPDLVNVYTKQVKGGNIILIFDLLSWKVSYDSP